MKKLLLLCSLFAFPLMCSAYTPTKYICIDLDLQNEEYVIDVAAAAQFTFLLQEFSQDKRPSPLLHLFHRKHKHNKKLTAAILAFPLPFGIVGLHRIYLGCAPYVPVVYIASFGGVLGLLPFVDFCYILAEKNKDAYAGNKKVFMWVD